MSCTSLELHPGDRILFDKHYWLITALGIPYTRITAGQRVQYVTLELLGERIMHLCVLVEQEWNIVDEL